MPRTAPGPDQHALRKILAGTITELQAIYPDELPYPHRVQLLHHRSLLEEVFKAQREQTSPKWPHLHDSLLASIAATLNNEATARS
ncbi:hypothetical protein [Hymenobacter sp. YC55]|uniref:hypothetical protein n=1 Tax=Hymenobacter sp. YC55 TaxID=3034019 RepID=UPI0023F6555C|nr:hypothetical protein [Hymenobacter sp. YC55]MDF7811485.1 hypothetical protein [Hymenobacter sp. YC55]